jgi:hypothetical protein
MLLRIAALIALVFVLFYLLLGAIVSHSIWPVFIAILVLAVVGFLYQPTRIADGRFTRNVGIGIGLGLSLSSSVPDSYGGSRAGSVLSIVILITGAALTGWRQHERSPGARGIARAISMSMLVALVAVFIYALLAYLFFGVGAD